MVTTLTEMPNEIRAGTTVEYTRTLTDYPASAHSLAVTIAGPSAAVAATVVETGDTYSVTLDAAATAALIPGNYQWVERVTVTASGKKYDVAAGQVFVLRDLTVATAGQAQTWEEKALALVETALTGRATADMESFSIAGRAITKIPVTELRAWREWLVWAVRQQRNPGTFGVSAYAHFPEDIRP